MHRPKTGPFRYKRYTDIYLDVAMRYAHALVKQAIISPSPLSLIYPVKRFPVTGASNLSTICCANTKRRYSVVWRRGAIRFKLISRRGRLAIKIDPSGKLLDSFIDLNNLALSRFSAEDRQRIVPVT